MTAGNSNKLNASYFRVVVVVRYTILRELPNVPLHIPTLT